MTLTLIPGNVSPGLIEGVVRIETNDRKFSVLEVPVSGYILEKANLSAQSDHPCPEQYRNQQ
jgi:hypothetical protein